MFSLGATVSWPAYNKSVALKFSKARFQIPLTGIAVVFSLAAGTALLSRVFRATKEKFQARVSVAVAAEQIADMVVHHIATTDAVPENWEDLKDDFEETNAAYNNFEFEQLRQMVKVHFESFSKVREDPEIELVTAISDEFECVAAFEHANKAIRTVLYHRAQVVAE